MPLIRHTGSKDINELYPYSHYNKKPVISNEFQHMTSKMPPKNKCVTSHIRNSFYGVDFMLLVPTVDETLLALFALSPPFIFWINFWHFKTSMSCSLFYFFLEVYTISGRSHLTSRACMLLVFYPWGHDDKCFCLSHSLQQHGLNTVSLFNKCLFFLRIPCLSFL